MSTQRKLKKRSTSRRTLSKRTAPVLIARPYPPEGLTCEETSGFLAFNFGNRIAEIAGRKSRVAETARNRYIEEFLTEKRHRHKTHIFFLDDDSPPLETTAILKLLRHQKPVVCAPTPIFRYDYELKNIICYWNTIVTTEGHTEEKRKLKNIDFDKLPKKMFKCYRTGGTGLLIRRDVLERLEPPYQKTTYNKAYTDTELSEDVYFSDKIRKAGFDIWADGTTVCRHFHRLDILDIVALIHSIKQDKYFQDHPSYSEMATSRLGEIIEENEKLQGYINGELANNG